ncbi:TIR domain-containing protein [bacterium]|nr:TIR domain-containing protein [bacterium]
MKVFIGWSGQQSGRFASILKPFLSTVIQAIKPYYSDDDIAKGSRWSAEIMTELEESKIGIICLTHGNLEEKWIMFEAGALSKNVGASKVCPILFGVSVTDVKGPLAQFQAAKFTKDDIKKLMGMINTELGDEGLTHSELDKAFEKWWPDLERDVESVLKSTDGATTHTIRPDREILEEILELTRTIAQKPTSIGGSKLQNPFNESLDPSESYYRNAIYRSWLLNVLLGTKKEGNPQKPSKDDRKLEGESES